MPAATHLPRHPGLAVFLLVLGAAVAPVFSGCGGSEATSPVASQGADEPGGPATALGPAVHPEVPRAAAKSPDAKSSPQNGRSAGEAGDGSAGGSPQPQNGGSTEQSARDFCGALSRTDCAQIAKESRDHAPSHPAKPSDCLQTMTRAECRALIRAEQNSGPSHSSTPRDCLQTMTRAECKALIEEELR